MTPAQHEAAKRGVTRVLAEHHTRVTPDVIRHLVDMVEKASHACGSCGGMGKLPKGRYVAGRGYLHRPCPTCKREREHEAAYDARSGIGAPGGDAA